MGHDSLKFTETYSCARDCKTAKGWSRKVRAGRGCSRPDLHPVVWDVTARDLHAPRRQHDADLYLGRYPDASLEGTVDLSPTNHELPREESSEGCPGGWYRTAFASSVLAYSRRRTDGAGRVENGLLRDADHQVWAAVLELEREQERAQAYATERGHDITAKARKKAERKRGR